MTERLPHVPAEVIAHTARGLTLTDFDTGATKQWGDPTLAQMRVWQSLDEHRKNFFAKPRRIYCSTALDLARLMWLRTCDDFGHRVRGGVFLDTEGTDKIKIRERMWQMTSFARQLGIPFTADTYRLVTGRGSELIAATAGGDRASASTGLQRIDLEEFSYYADDKAIAAITGSASKQAQITICTTVDITATNGKQARYYWREDKTFNTVFFSVEQHPEYRADPKDITDDDWRFAMENGFTNRSAAAYWLTELLSKCGGDRAVLMHEFPQREDHMFASGTGKVIGASPKVWEVGEVLPVRSIDGSTTWKVQIRGVRDEHGDLVVADNSGQLVMAIDTSGARGQSRSAVLLIDKRGGHIVASFASDSIWEDDLVLVASAIQARFRSHTEVPLALIEDNGIGEATVHAAQRAGLRYAPFHQTESSAAECIALAKRALEGLVSDGPAELAEECDELHVEIRGDRTVYKGRKDLIMCYGMCLVHRRRDGYSDKAAPRLRDEMHIRLQEDARRMRQMKRPPWGVG